MSYLRGRIGQVACNIISLFYKINNLAYKLRATKLSIMTKCSLSSDYRCACARGGGTVFVGEGIRRIAKGRVGGLLEKCSIGVLTKYTPYRPFSERRGSGGGEGGRGS